MEMGDYLRKLRGRTPQREVERHTQISQAYLSMVEKDKRIPSFRVLKELATVYNKNIIDLLKDIGYITENDLEKFEGLEKIYETISHLDVTPITDEKLVMLYSVANNLLIDIQMELYQRGQSDLIR